MVEEHRQVMETADKNHGRASKILADLISVASADRVYSEPVVAGDTTIITAAEIRTGMGFGYGLAAGFKAPTARMTRPDAKAGAESEGERDADDGRGGPRRGGGGGGRAVARPVAVITLGPDGVGVQPVLDKTRIALTALIGAGALGFTLLRKRRARRP